MTKVFKSFKYKLYVPLEIQYIFICWIGCCRKVYNYLLEKSQEQYKIGNKKFINRSNFQHTITTMKESGDFEYLKQVPIHTLQASAHNLLRSYDNFFKGIAKYPKFKSRYNPKQSFKIIMDNRVITNLDIKNSTVWIPKIQKSLKFNQSRKLEGKVVNFTITKENNNWYISFQCEVELPEQEIKTGMIGLDFGVINFITVSNGDRVPARQFYRSLESKLKKMQQALSKKTKDSNNYKKLKYKIAKLHAYIANCRKDANHKLSTKLVRENQLICVEDLQISKMSRNHKLAKSLVDEGWYQFTNFVQYKLYWYGGQLIKVDRFFPSSKTCNCCKCRINKLNLSQRIWTCPNCNTELDRDLNAAKNILDKGKELAYNL